MDLFHGFYVRQLSDRILNMDLFHGCYVRQLLERIETVLSSYDDGFNEHIYEQYVYVFDYGFYANEIFLFIFLSSFFWSCILHESTNL